MATFTAQLARNGVVARVARAVTQARRISTATLTALSSKRALPTALRGAAAAGPLPAAALRTSAPCCSASADSDVVELQLKVIKRRRKAKIENERPPALTLLSPSPSLSSASG